MKVTNVNDYVAAVHAKHPDLPEKEVKRILVYGLKMITQYVIAGNDICIKNNNFFFLIGEWRINLLCLFNYYCKKLATKIAYMYKRLYKPWDGYYYFALTENQFQEYLKQSKRKTKTFNHVFLYKILDECKVVYHDRPYIFRLAEDRTKRTRKYYKEIKTRNAELIIQRDPMKMKDVMTAYNKFKYIQ